MRHCLMAALVVSILHLASAPGRAAVVVSGSSGNGFQPFAGPNETGTPYFNNPSLDGSQMNVGYFLTGTGGFTGNAMSPNLPAGGLSWWGSPTGGIDPVQIFSSSGDVDATFLVSVAGLAASNQLGYRDSTGDHVLLTGAASGQTATFAPVGDFVFFLKSSGNTFFSDSTLAGNTEAAQHFAVFRENANGTLWIGVEDLPRGKTGKEGVGDFNDLVFSLRSIEHVPEPASAALFAVGIGLVVFRPLSRRVFRSRR